MESKNKLQLIRNGASIDIAESASIGGKEQLVLGNYDRDLLLRTKGSIRVQVQNKFYDLLSHEFVTNEDDVISNSVHFVGSINNLTLTTDGLVVDTSTSRAYYYYGGVLNPIEIDITPFIGDFISFVDVQLLNASQQMLAQRNIGYIFDTPNDVVSPPSDFLMYSLADEKHLKYKDQTWQELYLHLIDGGIVKNNTTFSKQTTPNRQALLTVDSTSSVDWNILLEDYSGLFVGNPNRTGGLAVHADQNGNVVLTSTVNSNSHGFKFKTFNQGGGLRTPMIISNNTVGIGATEQDIDLNYNLIVKDNTSVDSLVFNEILSHLNYDYLDLGWGREFGIGMYEDADLGGVVVADRIIEKSPEHIFTLNSTELQTLISKSYMMQYLELVEGTSTNQHVLVLSSHEDLEVNDILIAINTDPDTLISRYFIARIESIVNADPIAEIDRHLIVIVDATFEVEPSTKLFKVGNTTSGSFNPLVLNDGYANNIVAFSGITDPTQLLGGALPVNPDPDDYPSDEDYLNALPNVKLIPPTKTVVLGSLSELIDSDFSLNENEEVGLYSTNAYLKGKAILSSLTLGGELTWDGSTLNITDLETLKSRDVIAGDHLNGGGNLFSSNVTINHNPGSWVNKTTLSGARVISNLTVDTYGHITNWSTRNLTANGIGAISMNGGEVFGKLIYSADYGVSGPYDFAHKTYVDDQVALVDWGDFRDYGLGTLVNSRNSNFVLVNTSTETQAIGIDGDFFGINNTHRPRGFLIKGTINTRWSWLGVTDQGPLRAYIANSTYNAQSSVQELWHTENLTKSEFVNTIGHQSGLAGNKNWTGHHTFAPNSTSTNIAPNTIEISRNTNGPFIRIANNTGDSSFVARGYASNGVQMTLSEGGLELPAGGSGQSGIFSNGVVILRHTASNNTIVSGDSSNVYLRPEGDNATLNEAIFGASVHLRALSGSGIAMVVVSSSGVLSRQAMPTGAGGFMATSDIRVKNIIPESNYAAVEDLNIISFTYKDNRDDGRIHVGYSAQDVKNILPHAVYTQTDEKGEEIEDGLLSIDHAQILIAKVQILENKVRDLQVELLDMKSKYESE